MPNRVKTGLDVFRDSGFAQLKGKRIGLLANHATVDANLCHVIDLIHHANIDLATIFGPEHGFHGVEQDLIHVDSKAAKFGRARHVSLYGSTFESLTPTAEQLDGLDTLVIDLPDIGSRYYTFQATMQYCLQAAAKIGLPIVVLDRPNPIGGDIVEGPMLKAGFESFVGSYPLVTRHGMTLGELATLYRAELCPSADLRVIRCEGWRRDMSFQETGLPWVLPSPNMPTPDTALVYPGQCLLEGTNLSEGRGTTRPFEICGAPWINEQRLAARSNEAQLPGMCFRPLRFRPTFQKHAGQICGGIQIHVTDRRAFRPVRTGLAILHAMQIESEVHFRWRTEIYEFVSHIPAIDLLFGSDRERLAIKRGDSLDSICQIWESEEEAFRIRRQPHLLY